MRNNVRNVNPTENTTYTKGEFSLPKTYLLDQVPNFRIVWQGSQVLVHWTMSSAILNCSMVTLFTSVSFLGSQLNSLGPFTCKLWYRRDLTDYFHLSFGIMQSLRHHINDSTVRHMLSETSQVYRILFFCVLSIQFKSLQV